MAHLKKDTPGQVLAVQTVSQHCRQAAEYAAHSLASVSLSSSGYLAGLVHDMGKYTQRFQDYIHDGVGSRGSVNHTFAGVRFLMERYFRVNAEHFSGVVCELLSLACGGHHGTFDVVGEDHKNGFQHRLTKEEIGYEEAAANFLRLCAREEELDKLFQTSLAELTPVLEHILSMTDENSEHFDDETAFYSGLLSRLLLSAVIEGDRRDTAEFMDHSSFPKQRSVQGLEQLWSECLDRVESKLDELPQNSPIDRARRQISDRCRQAAEQSGGVFRLNVPTGSGKTLSGLRFALAHAKQHQKQRIIFTSPLLSILDQNAKEIRRYVQDDSLILEHHSNLVQDKENSEKLSERELLMETWSSPIIVTTLVQFLNTLFSGKTSAIQRFHSLCGSVIVIDEVQTVPSKLLTLFSLAVNFLSEICGAAVVLCSATQPCIEQIEHPIHAPISDIVPYSHELWKVFQRTEIQNINGLSQDRIVPFALEQLEKVDSLLIVCNKKAQAEWLFHQLEGSGFALFQLSAAMCVQHRRDTLDKLRASLACGQLKTVCVSTQVIEAGVDISFACVIRLAAGLDSVVQAAGRCNRNGEAGPGVLALVYLVNCPGESLAKLPDIDWGKAATLDLLSEFSLHPGQYQNRLDSDEAVGYYYRALYRRMPDGHHDYCVPKRPSLFALLSMNPYCETDTSYYFRQAFRLAGSLFQVFEENTTDVIVPYGKGAELISSLCGERAKHDFDYLKGLLEQAKPYTVSLYQYQFDRLAAEHALIPLQGGAWGLNGHYNQEAGFSMDEYNFDFWGVY